MIRIEKGGPILERWTIIRQYARDIVGASGHSGAWFDTDVEILNLNGVRILCGSTYNPSPAVELKPEDLRCTLPSDKIFLDLYLVFEVPEQETMFRLKYL